MSKRAAIYVRVSTKDQKDNGYSLPTQIEACTAYARECGYEIVSEAFQDDFTGMSMDRPALDKLREAIPALGIEVVIVLDLDRLARKTVYQMLIEEEFAKLGATIEYTNGRYADSDEGRLQKTIRSAVAEYERAKILERMKRGKRGKAKSGKVVMAAHTPYGYDRQGDVLLINEAEAAVVRNIYAWYTGPEQLSMHQIALLLSQQHVPPRRAASWQTSTVGRILKTETYAGKWHYNVRDTRQINGKQVTARRPKEEWIPVAVPAIIDEATFEIARERASENLTHSRRNRKHLYLFSGMLMCDGCKRLLGGTYHDTTHQRYQCTRNCKAEGARRCHLLTPTRESLIIGHVWAWLVDVVDNPERTRAALGELEAAHYESFKPLRSRLDTINNQLTATMQELRGVLDTHAKSKDMMPADLLDAWLADETKRIRRIQNDLEVERTEVQGKLDQHDWSHAQIEDVLVFCGTLRGRMQNATREKMRQTLEALRFRGRVTVEDGYKVLYASCALGEKRLDLQTTSTLLPR
jgi:site-specific DNA recombinase